MFDLFGYDNSWISLIKAHVLWWCDYKSDLILYLAEIQLFENVEMGAKKIKILRKSPLKLSKWSS